MRTEEAKIHYKIAKPSKMATINQLLRSVLVTPVWMRAAVDPYAVLNLV